MKRLTLLALLLALPSATRAAESFSGLAVIAFEDIPSGLSDHDFNDMVVRATRRCTSDASGNLVSEDISFTAVAAGAELNNALLLQLPSGTDPSVTITREGESADGPLPVSDDNVVLYASFADAFTGGVAGVITNTEDGGPVSNGRSNLVTITYGTPAPLGGPCSAPRFALQRPDSVIIDLDSTLNGDGSTPLAAVLPPDWLVPEEKTAINVSYNTFPAALWYETAVGGTTVTRDDYTQPTSTSYVEPIPGTVEADIQDLVNGMPLPPAQLIEFKLQGGADTSTWDLSGNITTGLTNTMAYSDANRAWQADGNPVLANATYIETGWQPDAGSKTACMWKKFYDAANISGSFGLDGFQNSPGGYFYYGSYQGLFYFYSGDAGGNATNQGTSPSGPTAFDWIFYCIASTGNGGTTDIYTAVPGGGGPVLRHHQANNTSDVGNAARVGGMRYGKLRETNQHPSKAYYGGMIHFDAALNASQITAVYNAGKVHYPGHGGSRGDDVDLLLGNMPVPPEQAIEFAIESDADTTLWDLTGNYTTEVSNSMQFDGTHVAYYGNGSSTFFDTGWKPGSGAKTACMWKRFYDAANMAGTFGLDGFQYDNHYFYYGSYVGTWYFYSGDNGGNATNQGNGPNGPSVNQWIFYCLTSTGQGGNSQYYTARPGDAAPVLRHNQGSNGTDTGNSSGPTGMRYGTLSSDNHPSKAYYGGVFHFEEHLNAGQITAVYNAGKSYYPGHGGSR